MKSIYKIVEIIKKNLKKDYDALMVITGKEGVGKSHLMLNILDYYNPKAKISDISLNKNDFRHNIRFQPRYGNPVFDEAGDGLFSREAMTSFNREIVKLYMAIRGRNLFTILVLPDFFDLDSFFRKHRVRFLIEVYKRGRFKLWDRPQIDIINQYNTFHRNITTKPLFYDTFPIYKGHLAEEYKKKKEEKIEEALNSLEKETSIENLPIKVQLTYLYSQLIKMGLEKPNNLLKKAGFKHSTVYDVSKNIK
ncbi:MAG TPA: hypothetical protein VKN74_08280 [Candidatus Mcinerneyibacterium sp.]|nr:hypothetical protein [Candidatus Mcinerneyibacterium sp.]